MKQDINLGNAVDDGTGDYLRQAGQKINNNFSDLYGELGDGERPFSAGAWNVIDGAEISTLVPEFGRAYAINTSTSPVIVNLPKGGNDDFGKVIKLRDAWGNWGNNNVTVYPATGDTIKGSNNFYEFYKNLQDLEFVYTSPGRWEFVDNKLLSQITVSDIPTVARKDFIAVDGQTDFTNIFGGSPYDPINLEVYHRGNLLYYGGTFSGDSEYGSMQDPNDGNILGIVELDGQTIRLAEPCEEGDTITIVSYSDNLANFRTSYNRETIKVFDSNDSNVPSSNQEVVTVDGLGNKLEWSLQDFGLSELANLNPQSFELYLNGRELTPVVEVSDPVFTCEGGSGSEQATCEASGGVWTLTNDDYHLVKNENNKYDRFFISEPFETGDIVTIKWYDNDIGTLQEWEGQDGLKEKSQSIFMDTSKTFNRSKQIRYVDPSNPSPSNVEQFTGVQENIRWDNVESFLESVYPVGSIYINANNPSNPADYMGFGTWVRYGEGRAIVGWDSNTDPYDPLFGLNNNDLDENEVPRHTAGGTGGSTSLEINTTNVPQLTSGEQVLVVDEAGDVIIGSCQEDPDEGPALKKYSEQNLNVNDGNTSPNDVSTVQPFITAHIWVRTE